MTDAATRPVTRGGKSVPLFELPYERGEIFNLADKLFEDLVALLFYQATGDRTATGEDTLLLYRRQGLLQPSCRTSTVDWSNVTVGQCARPSI